VKRRRTFSRASHGNGGVPRLSKTLPAAPPVLPGFSSTNEAVPQRRYRDLIRKHFGQLLDKLFAEFTGVHFHIAWAPAPPRQWDAKTLPTACSVCCRLSGSPLLPDCRTCGPRQLARALETDGDGHHFTCRLGVRNYWFPIRLRGETLGLAYLQALDSTSKHPARKHSVGGMHPRPGREDARVMSHLKFARAARFLRLIVQHSQTASLAGLQKEDLANVQRVLRVFENVQKRLRKKLNGLMPAFRETPPVAQSESRPERMVRAVLDRIHQDYAQPLTLQKCAGDLRVNAAYLSHLFSHAVGMPFKTCLTEVRVEKARELLGDSARNISHIAKAVGYASANRFGAAFKSVRHFTQNVARDVADESAAAVSLNGGVGREIWTAVAEHSGDTAFRMTSSLQKRRGASLPAALQNLVLRRQSRCVHRCPPAVLAPVAAGPWLKCPG
jgi:AraC-like DNA-binding protein